MFRKLFLALLTSWGAIVAVLCHRAPDPTRKRAIQSPGHFIGCFRVHPRVPGRFKGFTRSSSRLTRRGSLTSSIRSLIHHTKESLLKATKFTSLGKHAPTITHSSFPRPRRYGREPVLPTRREAPHGSHCSLWVPRVSHAECFSRWNCSGGSREVCSNRF